MAVRVLGVDPGTMLTGWAVVDCEGHSVSRVSSGTIRLGRGEVAGRLGSLHVELTTIIAQHGPAVMSLERNFVAQNVQSAFRLGEARGVAMAAAAIGGVDLHEYTPATIKKTVVGHGRADKSAVQVAVKRLFGLGEEPPPDEADALAAAACHAFRGGYDARVEAALAADPRGGGAATRRARIRARLPRRPG